MSAVTPALGSRTEGARPSAPSRAFPLPTSADWPAYTLAAVGATALWAACLWASAHVRADAALHTAALFGHMVSLVVGFGAVLVIDYFGLLWLTGKHTLGDVLRLTNSLHAPVWVGMAGLVLTGLFLNPDLSSTLTRLKVAAVLVIALNGICATALQRYLTRLAQEVPSQPVLLRGAAVAAVSQAGWWLAVVVGFLNSRD